METEKNYDATIRRNMITSFLIFKNFCILKIGLDYLNKMIVQICSFTHFEWNET